MSVDGKKQRVRTSRASGIQLQESRLVKSRASQYASQKSLLDQPAFVKPANLNEYIHILSGSKANDSDLGWILNLRINRECKTSMGTRRNSLTTISKPPEIEHLTRHRIKMTANPSQLSFETSLRRISSVKAIEPTSTEIVEKHSISKNSNTDFCTIPHKDKINEIPEYLPPMTEGGKKRINQLERTLKNFRDLWIKSKTNNSNIKMLSAFEGPYAFPNYNQTLREKNINGVVHLIRGVGGK